jgi:hypothetical protein
VIDGLTRPENCAELRDRRRVLSLLARCGGCALCTQRIEGWGKVGCKHESTFPMCTKGRRPKFELDEAALKERAA